MEADDTTVDADETSGGRRCTVKELLFRREDGHSPMEESGGLVSRAGGNACLSLWETTCIIGSLASERSGGSSDHVSGSGVPRLRTGPRWDPRLRPTR